MLGQQGIVFLGSFVFNSEYLKTESCLKGHRWTAKTSHYHNFLSRSEGLGAGNKRNDLASRIQTQCIAFEDRR